MTVAPDTLCVTCGYALANIDPSGLCPECGTPVARSLRISALEDSSPRYLSVLWWSLVASLVSWLLSISGFLGEEFASIRYTTIIVLASLFGELLGCAAAYFFASPDPARLLDRHWERLRQLTRIVAVVDICFQCVSVSLRVLLPGPVATAVGTVTEVVSQLTFILTFRLGANLALRAGSPRIALQFRRMSWSLVVLGVGILAMSLSEIGGPTVVDIVGTASSVPMMVALLFFFYYMTRSIPPMLTLLAKAGRESLRKGETLKA
jgi:hypothetical protein